MISFTSYLDIAGHPCEQLYIAGHPCEQLDIAAVLSENSGNNLDENLQSNPFGICNNFPAIASDVVESDEINHCSGVLVSDTCNSDSSFEIDVTTISGETSTSSVDSSFGIDGTTISGVDIQLYQCFNIQPKP